ncbi:MAG: hypothetical protein ABR583_00735 [Gaiellaceae bacterium]
MEEARRMLERLDRIDGLHLAGAPAAALLDELRGLLGDAEDWLAAEGSGAGGAAAAVERCRAALSGTSDARGESDEFRAVAGA